MDKRQIVRTLQSFFTASLFALSLYYFFSGLMAQYTYTPLPSWQSAVLPLLIFCLLCGLLLEHWKIALPILGGFLLLLLLQFFLNFDLHLPILSLSYWQEKGRMIVHFLEWFQHSSIEKPLSLPYRMKETLIFLSGFIAVLTTWTLPIPLLNMLFLILPLFFMEHLDQQPYWLVFLAIGLFCVYASYAFRQDPNNRDQRPPISFGLVLVSITLILSSLLPPELFFFRDLNRKLNEYRPMEGGEITAFSLGELGFYPQGSLTVGGPAKPSKEPYLAILSDAASFYLRGASYDAFDGHHWSYQAQQTLRVFPWNKNYFDDFSTEKAKTFWFPSAAARDQAFNQEIFQPVLFYQRMLDSSRIVFTAGKPALLARMVEDLPASMTLEDALGQSKVDTSFLYSSNGMVISEQDSSPYGLVSMDHRYQTRLAVEPTRLPALQVQQGSGARQYEGLVKKKDPILYNLIYQSKEPLASRLVAVRAHFDQAYRYALDVPEIKKDEIFLDNFLTIKKGYCIYFATALANLLQDIGYDVRYVEGFVVPAADTPSTGLISRTLTGEQAHAWVEILDQNLGWIPLEATPTDHVRALSGESLTGEEENSSSSEASSSSSESSVSSEESSSESVSEPISESMPDDSSTPPEISPDSPLTALGWKILFSILFIVLLLLAFGLVQHKKRKRWKERQDPNQLMESDRTEETVERIWQEILRLSALSGLSIKKEDTVRTLLIKVGCHLASPMPEAIIRSMENVQYGHMEIEEKSLRSLHAIYRILAQRRKEALSKPAWLLKEVWRTPFKPW